MKHYNITVKGKVQGVGFRYSALKMAREYGINGFVRNEPDGSVYLEAEGEETALNQFIKWCHEGPGFGKVQRVTEVESGLQGFQDFNIRH